MELLVVLTLVTILVLLAMALGQVWAPLLTGFTFLGIAALFLLSGYASPWPQLGVLYLGGSLGELVVADEYWAQRGVRGGPSAGWRLAATLIGLAGCVLFVVMLLIVAAAIGSFYSQL
jgi:hypothetical protein